MSVTFKIPKPHHANIMAIADFAELECLRRADGNVSVLDVSRIMDREGTDWSDGNGTGSEESVPAVVQTAFDDLADRIAHCGKNASAYPYRLRGNNTLLQFNRRSSRSKDSHMLYLYLLLATRMNMRDDRVQAAIDGTQVFESLCCEVARRYWGGPADAVNVHLFGTARLAATMDDDDDLDHSAFERAVNGLCKAIGEGQGFDSQVTKKPKARDGRLDIVVWRRFADQRAGQLIGFGQSKTGTHWKPDLSRLQPRDFVDKWMRRAPAVIPVRLYFMSERVIDDWYDHCKDGGIMFDRCRIVEHSHKLPATLRNTIRKWTSASLKAARIRLP